MGNEHSTIKMIALVRQKNDTSLSARGEALDHKWVPDNAATLELQNLKLIDMGLQILPAPMLDVHTLKRVDLSQNKLVSVNGIGKLSQLTHLDISNNLLDYLPDDISDLKNLKMLAINGNMLTKRSIPAELLSIPLTFLDLRDNKLKDISLILAQSFMKLEVVRLSGNPWEHAILQGISKDSSEDEVKAALRLFFNILIQTNSKAVVSQTAKATDQKIVSQDPVKVEKPELIENIEKTSTFSTPKATEKQIENERISAALEAKPIVDKVPTSPQKTQDNMGVSNLNENASPMNEVKPLDIPKTTPLKSNSRISGPKGRKPPVIGAFEISEENQSNVVKESVDFKLPPRPVLKTNESKNSILLDELVPNTIEMNTVGTTSKIETIDYESSKNISPLQIHAKSGKPISKQSNESSISGGVSIQIRTNSVNENDRPPPPILPKPKKGSQDDKRVIEKPLEAQLEKKEPEKVPKVYKPNMPQLFDISELKNRQKQSREVENIISEELNEKEIRIEPKKDLVPKEASNMKPTLPGKTQKSNSNILDIHPNLPEKPGKQSGEEHQDADVPKIQEKQPYNQLTANIQPPKLPLKPSKKFLLDEQQNVNAESSIMTNNPPLPPRSTKGSESHPDLQNEINNISQLRETLNKQLSNIMLKKVDQEAPVNSPKESGMPAKIASPKSIRDAKEESIIPPWKSELEKRKQQQPSL